MEKYYFINGISTDAPFNIASEEYLLKETNGYYIYVWQNAPAVIVGVNQNTLEEVELGYAEKQGIKVVRRLTGGGAVYHDLNNICYTVIAPYNKGEETFKRFSTPVIEYLKTLGVEATFSGRNDILVDGKKISGTAETVYKNRIMHHGTLLFESDYNTIEKVLSPSKVKIESKGIKSVKSRVTGVKEHLKSPLSISEFKSGLCEFLKKELEEYLFTGADLERINNLATNKYSTFAWNIGYSPKGKNKIEERFSFGTMTFNFDLIDGKIENPLFLGDFFLLKPLDNLYQKLNGVEWKKDSVSIAISDIDDYIKGAKKEEIIVKFFE